VGSHSEPSVAWCTAEYSWHQLRGLARGALACAATRLVGALTRDVAVTVQAHLPAAQPAGVPTRRLVGGLFVRNAAIVDAHAHRCRTAPARHSGGTHAPSTQTASLARAVTRYGASLGRHVADAERRATLVSGGH